MLLKLQLSSAQFLQGGGHDKGRLRFERAGRFEGMLKRPLVAQCAYQRGRARPRVSLCVLESRAIKLER